MKKRKIIKSKKRKPTKKPIKQLKRGTYRGTAEARKLKQKWMDSLQSMIGDIPIDWNRAAMFYDQGIAMFNLAKVLFQYCSIIFEILGKGCWPVIFLILAGF